MSPAERAGVGEGEAASDDFADDGVDVVVHPSAEHPNNPARRAKPRSRCPCQVRTSPSLRSTRPPAK